MLGRYMNFEDLMQKSQRYNCIFAETPFIKLSSMGNKPGILATLALNMIYRYPYMDSYQIYWISFTLSHL